MAIMWHKIKTLNPKKTLLVVGLAGMVALAISFAVASAQTPAFNIFPISYTAGTLNHDLPLIDARNFTKNTPFSVSQSDHDNGVNVDPGEVVDVAVYFHNGAPEDATGANKAINAIVKAFASPSLGTAAGAHTLSATISANNAATVNSANKGGNIQVHVQGGTPQTLTLVPGSVKIFKDQGTSPKPAPVSAPDTVFTSGVNLGNVDACFPFHGFVKFRLQVSSQQPPPVEGNLTLQKDVKNVTKNTGFQLDQVTADPSDLIEYQIRVRANTNAVANITMKDALDPRLSIVGNVTYDGAVINSSQFFGSGASLGTISANVTKTVKFQAKVAGSGSFTSGTHTLTNVATAAAPGQSLSDGANVIVTVQPQQIVCVFTWDLPHVSSTDKRGLRQVGQMANVHERITGLNPNETIKVVDQHVSGNPVFKTIAIANSQGVIDLFSNDVITSAFVPGDYNVFIERNGVNVASCLGFRIVAPTVQNLNVDKTVKNLTTGTGFQDQVSATPAQRVMFQLVITAPNSNTDLQSAVVSDTLPSKMTFVSGTFKVDGVAKTPGGFFTAGQGHSIGTIPANGQRVITFEADVASGSSFTTGSCEVLINTTTISSGSLTSSDTATVSVCKDEAVKLPGAPTERPTI